ncbi:uncharacterized protein LOC116811798 isoform X1 [Hylobates moloch]|uniref:uncharacterized protein LOC116811798 isoform X1 n=1 Tax=Hylobates moloch TaxID=81572 RepID=UPI0024437125|nr:uncharacterized protein LOC116811798 isoform X1 [Hylobates moloch]XP_055124371.1 uncharacterized protein LOC129475925 [Symphalangus syndactylus]
MLPPLLRPRPPPQPLPLLPPPPRRPPPLPLPRSPPQPPPPPQPLPPPPPPLSLLSPRSPLPPGRCRDLPSRELGDGEAGEGRRAGGCRNPDPMRERELAQGIRTGEFKSPGMASAARSAPVRVAAACSQLLLPPPLGRGLARRKTEVSAEDYKCYVIGRWWPWNFTCPAHILSSSPPLPSLGGRNQKEWGCSSESRGEEKKRRKKEED